MTRRWLGRALAVAVLAGGVTAAYVLKLAQADELPPLHSEHTCCLWFDAEAFDRIRIGTPEADFRQRQGVQAAVVRVHDDPKCLDLIIDGDPATVVRVLITGGVVARKWLLHGSEQTASCDALPRETVNVADVVCYHQR